MQTVFPATHKEYVGIVFHKRGGAHFCVIEHGVPNVFLVYIITDVVLILLMYY